MDEAIKKSLTEALHEIIGTGCEITFREVTKNNGRRLRSVTVREKGALAAPTVYIDEELKALRDGEMTIEDVAGYIADAYKDRAGDAKAYGEILEKLDKEDVLRNVTFQMVNERKNREALLQMPHEEMLDLAAVCSITVGRPDGQKARMRINNDACKAFGIDEKELFVAAKYNTEAKGFRITPLDSVLKEILTGMGRPQEGPETEVPGIGTAYLLTTCDNAYGASVLMCPHHFGLLAKKLEDDLYILPSSVHEVIAVPEGACEPEDLKAIIRDINHNSGCVAKEEFLSDHLYRYSQSTGEVTVA